MVRDGRITTSFVLYVHVGGPRYQNRVLKISPENQDFQRHHPPKWAGCHISHLFRDRDTIVPGYLSQNCSGFERIYRCLGRISIFPRHTTKYTMDQFKYIHVPGVTSSATLFLKTFKNGDSIKFQKDDGVRKYEN